MNDWIRAYTATRRQRTIERSGATLGLSPRDVALLLDPFDDDDEEEEEEERRHEEEEQNDA